MAGAKKKKKPAANPARGFATTSIASKPRPEVVDEPNPISSAAPPSAKNDKSAPPTTTSVTQDASKTALSQYDTLSPEDFEKQLNQSELQLLVEKHSQKIKRDARRQRSRLETDKRLLRGQADSVNSMKWLPQDIMDHILDLIKAESRFAASSLASENPGAGRMPSEEDMITRLWTLQQTLTAAKFPEHRVAAVIQHILDISPTISSGTKDLIWGLEEALEWLARECQPEELPAYESRLRPTPKGTHLLLRLNLMYAKLTSSQIPPMTAQCQVAQAPLDRLKPVTTVEVKPVLVLMDVSIRDLRPQKRSFSSVTKNLSLTD